MLDNKNNIRSKKNYTIKKSKENKKDKENKKNDEHNGNYKLNEDDKIIDDNYNEYLKGIITSSESNKSQSEKNILNKKNSKILIKKIKPRKKKLVLNDRSENSKRLKRLNHYNYSSVMFRNNKKILQFRKLNSNNKKILYNINNSIIIENDILGEKIILFEKNIFK